MVVVRRGAGRSDMVLGVSGRGLDGGEDDRNWLLAFLSACLIAPCLGLLLAG